MRFHWYWPFAREEELDWAVGTARPGESLLVQVIDREHAPAAGTRGPVTVVRDLPDVNRRASRLAWLPSRVATYARRAFARNRMARAEDFDLLHVHYVNRFTDVLARLPRPLVMSVHDVVPHVNRLGKAEHALLRRLYGRADGLVVHHAVLADRLAGEFGIRPERVHVVPHQVFWAPETVEPPRDRPPMVLFFGALRANKGLPVLLDAMVRMSGDIRLVIAGRGDPALEALSRQAAERDPRITAELGFVSLERKRELFAEASVAVLPYTAFASQSGVLHDAYGHGRPVVVTGVGALGDTVRHDGTGVVARPDDSVSLADAIRRVLEQDSWNSFAAASAAIRRDRSPQRTGELLRQVYDQVLD